MNTIFKTAAISDLCMQSDIKNPTSEKKELKGLDFSKILGSLKEEEKTSQELKKTISNALQNMSDKEGEELLDELKSLVKDGDKFSRKTLKKIKKLLSGIKVDGKSSNKLLSKFMKVINGIDTKESKKSDDGLKNHFDDVIDNNKDIDAQDLENILENLEKIGEILEKITNGRMKLKVEVENEVEDTDKDQQTIINVFFNGKKNNEKIKEGNTEKTDNNEDKTEGKQDISNDELLSENVEEVSSEASAQSVLEKDVPNRVLKALKTKMKENIKETVEVKGEGSKIKETTIKVIEKELTSKEGNRTILKTTIIVEKMDDDVSTKNDHEKFMRFSNMLNNNVNSENSEKTTVEDLKDLRGTLKTYSPGEVVEHLTQRVKYSDVNGKQLMTMNLKPGELGQVKVLISRVDGKMDIRIMTENGEAKNALMANASELKANLKGDGVNLNAFEITVNPDGRNGQENEKKEKDNEKKQKNRQKAKTINFQDVIRAFGPIQRRDVNVNV